MGTATLHGGVRCGVIWLVEETEVRDFDAGTGIEFDVCDEVVCIGLFPVTGAAVSA